MPVNYTNLPDNKNKPFGGAYSIYDKESCEVRDYAIKSFDSTIFRDKDKIEKLKIDFFNEYKKWMFSSHNITGYESYNTFCFTNGTRESFYNYHLRYLPTKRLRLMRGEYYFNQMLKGIYPEYVKFEWLEDSPIKENDFVLISVPFSDTGEVPNFLEDMLISCDLLKVPVMLDLAYLNISKNLSFSLDHECIKYVVTSLSKVFPIENFRIGLRLQKDETEDQLNVVNEPYYNYINLLSAHVGLSLLKAFPANYIYDKYKSKQLQFCKKLDLTPSKCVYFGIDHKNKYNDYNRGRDTNRLCFTRIWDRRMNYEL